MSSYDILVSTYYAYCILIQLTLTIVSKTIFEACIDQLIQTNLYLL